MAVRQSEAIQAFDKVRPGDHVEIEQTVEMEGILLWKIRTRGTVIHVEQPQPGYRNPDDKVHGGAILLHQASGEFTNIAIDESTVIRHLH